MESKSTNKNARSRAQYKYKYECDTHVYTYVCVWHMQLDIGYIVDVGKRYSLARLVRHISSQAMTQEESSKQSKHTRKEQGIIPQVA